MQAFGKQASARVSHRRISSCIAGICSEFRKKRNRKGVSRLSENETITAQKFQRAFSSLAPLSAHIGRFKRLNQSSR
jgi:hypothetical protein